MANAESSTLDESELKVHYRAKLGIIEIGLDRVVRFANPEALRILGATEYCGRSFDEALANKESSKSLMAELEARQRGEISSYQIEIKRQSDLRTVPVSITGIPLRDRNKEVIGSLGVLKSLEIEEAVNEVERINSTAQTSGLIVKVSEYLCRTFPADAVLVTRYSRPYGHANPFLLYRFQHRTPVEPNASAEPNVWVERQKRWIPLNPEQQNWVDSSSVVAIDDIADYMEKGIWKNKRNDAMIERLLADGYTCSLTRPIRRRGRVVGMISLLRKGGRKFDKSAEEIIRVLPLDAAVVHEIDAVDRDQHERRFKLLQELSRCNSARSAAKILATRLVQIFAWSHVSIFRVDYVNKQIRMVAQHWSDEDGAMLPEGYHQGLHDGVLGRVVDTKQDQFVPDVNKDRDYLFNFRSDVGAPLKSEACCPIIWGGDRRVRWIINIEDSDENAFSEEEISWLKDVASEVGGMMESLGAIEFYSECFRNTSEATIVADVEFDIKKANPAAARLLGYASDRDIQGSMKSLLQDERDFARLQQLPNQEAAEFFLRYGSRDAPQSALFLDSLNAIADTALASDCQNQASAEKDKTRCISVSIARTELPPDLGGSIFVLTDTRVIRDTVKREVLAKATYDVAVETRTPLALAMTALSRVSDSAPREIADTIGKALSYLARVDLGFKKLALFNESVAISPHKGRVDLQAELDALVAGLPLSLQPSISISPAPGPVVVLADHFQVALLFEIVLTLLVRRVAGESPFVVSVVAGHDAAVVCFRAFVRADTHRDRRMADIRGELAVCEPLIRRLAANNEATVTAEVADAEHFELRVAFAQTAPGGQR